MGRRLLVVVSPPSLLSLLADALPPTTPRWIDVEVAHNSFVLNWNSESSWLRFLFPTVTGQRLQRLRGYELCLFWRPLAVCLLGSVRAKKRNVGHPSLSFSELDWLLLWCKLGFDLR